MPVSAGESSWNWCGKIHASEFRYLHVCGTSSQQPKGVPIRYMTLLNRRAQHDLTQGERQRTGHQEGWKEYKASPKAIGVPMSQILSMMLQGPATWTWWLHSEGQAFSCELEHKKQWTPWGIPKTGKHPPDKYEQTPLMFFITLASQGCASPFTSFG